MIDLTDKDQNLLVELPYRHLNKLSSSFSGIDWRNSKSALYSKVILEDELVVVLQFVKSWAELEKIPLDRLWRNLIACSSKRYVDFYWLPLRFAEQQGEVLLGDRQAEILLMLPPPNGFVGMLFQFLERAPEVSEEMINFLAPRQRVSKLLAFNRHLLKTTPITTQKYVGALLSKSAVLFGTNRDSKALYSVTKLLKETPTAKKLSMAGFHRLPEAFKKDILSSESLRHDLLGASTIRSIQPILNKAKELGVQVNIPLPEELLAKIEEGDLASPIVIQCFKIWGIDDKRLIKPIRACEECGPSKVLADWLAIQAPSTARLSLRLLATRTSKWSHLLTSIGSKALVEVTDILGPDRILEALFTDGMTAQNASQIQEVPALKRASVRVLSAQLLHLTYWSKWCKENQTRSFVSNIFTAILFLIDQEILADRNQSALEQQFNKLVAKSKDAKGLLGLIQPKVLKVILNSSGRCRKFGTSLVRAFRSRAFVQLDLFEHYKELISKHGDLILEVAGVELTTDEIHQMFYSRRAKSFLVQVSNEKFRKSLKNWDSYLVLRSNSNRNFPAKLRGIIAADLKWLAELYRRFPEMMAPMAIEKLTLPELLPIAFKQRSIGSLIDKKISRKKLVSAHDWLSIEFAAKSRAQAAYELALEYGIRFAPYLVSLARQLPSDQSNEGNSFEELYRVYKIPKKSGGFRTITVPDDHLKALQRIILRTGFEILDDSPHAFGFRKGRSIVDNARIHVRSDVVVNVDIRSFFPSTNFTHVRRVCKDLAGGRLSPMAQWLASEICCYQGGLPTGAPTSPAIANIVLKNADNAIAKACEMRGIRYTRYADDLTFSGSGEVTNVLPFVTRVLAEMGFELADKKTNIFRKGRRQIVTGLVVNEKPNMARPLRKRLRAAVHTRLHGGQALWRGKPTSDRELLGRIAFLGQTQPEEASRLRSTLTSVMETS